MSVKGLFKHIALVINHKNKVLYHCAKCGLLWRGLVHDMSKFSPTELFESSKYYCGDHSPIEVCRQENGVSNAWLHHKGRNRHHIEYWMDYDLPEHPPMPYKFAVECVCDKLAATKTYNGKNYTPDKAIAHWRKVGGRVESNPKNKLFIETVLTDIAQQGEDFVLNKEYMRKTYDRIYNQDK